MAKWVCVVCNEKPPRVLPDPIPEGMEVMFTEGMAGRGLYCEGCFEAAALGGIGEEDE